MILNLDSIKETVTKNFNGRLNQIESRIKNCCLDSQLIMDKAWYLIKHENAGVAYSLFKDLHCYDRSLESLENLQSFASNLFDDATFAIAYDTDLNLYKMQDEDRAIHKEFEPLIHLSGFSIVWSSDNDPAKIKDTEMSTFLDWFIAFQEHQFIYIGNDVGFGPKYDMSLIQDWNLYPKQLKIAYEAYARKIGQIEHGVFT